jgi:transposase
VVATGIFGVCGRDMMDALVVGERNPKVLARLARRTLRKKITLLEEAFTGRFTDHHASLLGTMLTCLDVISEDTAALDARAHNRLVEPHRSTGAGAELRGGWEPPRSSARWSG